MKTEPTFRSIRTQHNSLVKNKYVVNDEGVFAQYLEAESKYDETLTDGCNYIEIPSNQTVSGNLAVISW